MSVSCSRTDSTRSSPMLISSQHTAPTIDTVIYNKKVVIAWKGVFVDAVEPAFLWCATEAVAGWDEAGVLRSNFSKMQKRCVEKRNGTGPWVLEANWKGWN